jgi:hypothetical protein
MKNILGKAIKATSITLFITILCAAIGSVLISRLIWEGLFTSWKELPVPPEPAEKIVYAGLFSVEIQSGSGNIYSFIKEGKKGGKPVGRWVLIDEPTPYDRSYGKFSADLVLPYLGKIKDKVAFHYQGVEESINGQFVITTEGNIAWWQGTWGLDCILYGSIYGAILGVFIGILVSIRSDRKRSSSEQVGIAA